MSTYYYVFVGAEHLKGVNVDPYTNAVLRASIHDEDLTGNILGAALTCPDARLLRHYRRGERGNYTFGLPEISYKADLGNMNYASAKSIISQKYGIPESDIVIKKAMYADKDTAPLVFYALAHSCTLFDNQTKGWAHVPSGRPDTDMYYTYDPNGYSQISPSRHGILRTWETRCADEYPYRDEEGVIMYEIDPYSIRMNLANNAEFSYNLNEVYSQWYSWTDDITDKTHYDYKKGIRDGVDYTSDNLLPIEDQVHALITWERLSTKNRERFYTVVNLPNYGVEKPPSLSNRLGNGFPVIPIRSDFDWYYDHYPDDVIKNIERQFSFIGLGDMRPFTENLANPETIDPNDLEKVKDIFYLNAVSLYTNDDEASSYIFEYFKFLLEIAPGTQIDVHGKNSYVVTHEEENLNTSIIFKSITKEEVNPLSHWDSIEKRPKWIYTINWEYDTPAYNKDNCLVKLCEPFNYEYYDRENTTETIQTINPECIQANNIRFIPLLPDKEDIPGTTTSTLKITKLDINTLDAHEIIRVHSLGFVNTIKTGPYLKKAGYFASEIEHDLSLEKQRKLNNGEKYTGTAPREFPIPLAWYPFDRMNRKERRTVASNFGFLIICGSWTRHVSWWVEWRNDMIELTLFAIQIYLTMQGLGQFAVALQSGTQALIEYIVVTVIKKAVMDFAIEELGLTNVAILMAVYGLVTGKATFDISFVAQTAIKVSIAVQQENMQDLKEKLDKELALTSEEKEKKEEDEHIGKEYVDGKRYNVPVDVIKIETVEEFHSRTLDDHNVANATYNDVNKYGTMSTRINMQFEGG